MDFATDQRHTALPDRVDQDGDGGQSAQPQSGDPIGVRVSIP